jgi:transcriptional regulator with XRE-family HTH domain
MQLFFRAARKRLGWRLRDVGDVLGRSESWVSRMENGEAVLTLRQLVRLARLFNLHPWDLVLFERFLPPTRWPAPLCETCQARCKAALLAAVAEEGVPDRDLSDA